MLKIPRERRLVQITRSWSQVICGTASALLQETAPRQLSDVLHLAQIKKTGLRGAGGKTVLSTNSTLRKMTWGWAEGIMGVAKAFQRLDAVDGNYLKEIQVRWL